MNELTLFFLIIKTLYVNEIWKEKRPLAQQFQELGLILVGLRSAYINSQTLNTDFSNSGPWRLLKETIVWLF